MRHRVHGRKLNRSPAHRIALRRNLVRSLFLTFKGKKHIVTTREKAKFVQPFAEKLITLAKERTLHNYRRAISLLRDETAAHILFEQIGPAFKDRPGGYTRIVRLQRRRLGDRASQVLFAFVLDQEVVQEAQVVESEAE